MVSFEAFEENLRNHVLTNFRSLLEQSKAEEAVTIAKHLNVSSNADFDLSVNREIRLHLKVDRFSQRNITMLSILSWFLPEITRWELQESMRFRIKMNNMVGAESYLYSYNLCVFKLYRMDDYTHSDIFGNILDPRVLQGAVLGDRKSFRRLRVWLYLPWKQRPETGERKRGYNDHGSLANASSQARNEANQASVLEIQTEELRRTTMRQKHKVSLLLDLARIIEEGIDP